MSKELFFTISWFDFARVTYCYKDSQSNNNYIIDLNNLIYEFYIGVAELLEAIRSGELV